MSDFCYFTVVDDGNGTRSAVLTSGGDDVKTGDSVTVETPDGGTYTATVISEPIAQYYGEFNQFLSALLWQDEPVTLHRIISKFIQMDISAYRFLPEEYSRGVPEDESI